MEFKKEQAVEYIQHLLKGSKPTALDIVDGIITHARDIVDRELYPENMLTHVLTLKLYTVVNELRNNPNLVSDINDGKVEPKTLATMSPKELNPEVNRKYYELKKKRDVAKITLKTVTDYKCPKCGGIESVISQVRTSLGGDEPFSVFSTCIKCQYSHRI